MSKVSLFSQFGNTRYMMSSGIYWLLLTTMIPIAIAIYQTNRTAETSVRQEAERVAFFFISEVDDILGETERVMDTYMQSHRGSCAPSDLAVLQKHMVTTGNVLSMGIVSGDGNITCTIGKEGHGNLVFPPISKRDLRKPQFAEIRGKQGSLPMIIKQSRDDLRIFAIVSKARFARLLLPGSLAEHTQIDLVLPEGGLWYTLTGPSVTSGFTDNIIKIDRTSSRFPVVMSMVVDAAAMKRWSGALYATLITIMIVCAIGTLLTALARVVRHRIKRRREAIERARIAENAHSLFTITYEPLLDLDSRLLVGAVARADLSIFDAVADERPTVDRIISMIWDEIGPFATKRRTFNLIIEIDGQDLIDPGIRDAVMTCLKEISYGNLSLLLKWPADRAVDPKLYRPLEMIATAGTQLAVECGGVRFSFLSDMWAWPYHQLVLDFAEIPDSEEAINWMIEIIINMSEQLQVDVVAFGIDDPELLTSAVGNGFKVGCGRHIGPSLTIDSLMAAVRHVGTAENDDTDDEQEAA